MNTSAVCRFYDVVDVPIRPMPVRISRPHSCLSAGAGGGVFDDGVSTAISLAWSCPGRTHFKRAPDTVEIRAAITMSHIVTSIVNRRSSPTSMIKERIRAVAFFIG